MTGTLLQLKNPAGILDIIKSGAKDLTNPGTGDEPTPKQPKPPKPPKDKKKEK